MKMWPGRGGQMGGPRWPNGRKGDRRLLWPSVWKIFFRSGQILQFTHDLFQFYQAFGTKNFVGWENDSQSWNPCFLGVRSPNQLPKASWLGNLTSENHAGKWSIIFEVALCEAAHTRKQHLKMFFSAFLWLFSTVHCIFTLIALYETDHARKLISKCFLCISFFSTALFICTFPILLAKCLSEYLN